ncbi:MAG TPA: protein meaA, partial [Leptospiraceae bacterium]|nr:protein meaA [Leptospiraceae bacterium]
ELADQIVEELKKAGAYEHIPVVFGGIIPKADFESLTAKGIKKIFTPSDFELIDIMEKIFDIVEQNQSALV